MKHQSLVSLALAIVAFVGTTNPPPQDSSSRTKAAQPDTEEFAIRETIEKYFDGYDRGDVELLKQTFHEDCVIKYLDLRTKKYSTFNMEELNEFMANLPEGWKSVSKFYSIDHTGSAAQAKVSVTVMGGRLTWTDYMGLLKINDKWTIVSKVSHGAYE